MTAPDVWAEGAMTVRAAGDHLGGLCAKTVRRIASAERWPEKLVGGLRVYPARLVRAFLAACPSPAKRKERVT